MDFSEALKAMKAGKKVKKIGWESTYIIFESPDNFYRVHPSKVKEDWYFGNNDILAEDWDIVEDISEVKLQRSKDTFYICPYCNNHIEIIVYSEDVKNKRYEWECHRCGKTVKIVNLADMYNEVNSIEGKIKDDNEKTIVAFAKIIIKYTGYPEKAIEETLENIRFEGLTEDYQYRVVDAATVDIIPIQPDF